jgi:hypothetical protein
MKPMRTTPAGDAAQAVVTLPARLGWRIRLSEIIFGDPPYLVMQSIPVFPGCHEKLAERDIVWDVFALMNSVRRPGAHQVLTCECGYAPDANLQEAIMVSHPDADTVVWELDIPGLRPALDEAFDQDQAGFVRLIFARGDYESDIRAMLRELQLCASTPRETRTLPSDVHNLEHLHTAYPNLDLIRVDDLEPDSKGLALERLLESNAEAVWEREPMWPAQSLLEFGFFSLGDGHELIRVNGALAGRIWPEWHFTRWEVWAAFGAWLAYTQRAFALGSSALLSDGIGINEFVLLQEQNRLPCHEAGRRLAAVMQASLQEGATAPGVTVRYCECPLHVVTPQRLADENDD